MKLRPWLIWHPFLIAMFPVLFLYVTNLGSYPMDVRDVFLPLVINLIGAGIVYALFGLILRRPHRAAIVTSLFIVLFFSFGRLDFLHSTVGAEWTAVYISFLFLLGIAAALLFGRWLPAVTRWLTIVATILVIGQPIMALTRPSTSSSSTAAPTETTWTVNSPARPDIYIIILDAYGGASLLRDMYDYDNTPFLSELRTRGFDVVEESRSNYNQTVFSMTTMFHMNLLDEIGRLRGEPVVDTPTLNSVYKNNPVMRFAQSLGYTTVAYQTSFPLTDFKNADVFLEPNGGLSEFQNLMIATTPIPYILRGLNTSTLNEILRRQTLFVFDHLAEQAKKAVPTFTYAHVVSPHPPFLFNADGSPTTDPMLQRPRDGDRWALNDEERARYRQAYIPQLQYLNTRVLKVVDDILATSPEPPVIVLMSDHGPGSEWRGNDLAATNLRERYSNLLSIYMPPGTTPAPYRGMSLVNVFPVVFNRVFGSDIPFRADRYFFASLTDPHNPTDITATIKP